MRFAAGRCPIFEQTCQLIPRGPERFPRTFRKGVFDDVAQEWSAVGSVLRLPQKLSRGAGGRAHELGH